MGGGGELRGLLIVKFRGLSPPPKCTVCAPPPRIYALLIAKSGASLQCYCNCCCIVIAGK